MKRTLAALALCLCATIGVAQPNYMNYQGKLITGDGSALPPGQHIVEINLYDDPTAGNKVWGPFIMDGDTGPGHAEFVSVMNDGRFNIIVGPKDTTGRDISSAFQHSPSGNRFIELKVNGGDPILPRQQFLSAPYAFQASRLPDVSNPANGNVGIGTDSPTEKLDVSGNVKISGTLNVSGQATLGSAQVNGNLRVGNRTISTSGGVLNVDGGTKVNGDFEFTGRVLNFSFTGENSRAISEPNSGNNPRDDAYNLNIASSNYFCALTGLSWYSSSNAGRSDNGAWLDVNGGSWHLTMRADGNGYTWASVRCFKFR